MRLFTLIGLGLTLTVTAACNGGGKRRQSIKAESSNPTANSPRSKAINSMVGDGKCLRVDKLLGALAQAPNETTVEYTAETNFIEKDGGLMLDVVPAGQLLKTGGMMTYLNLSYDEKCTTVTLNIPEMAANQAFTVDTKKSGKNQLVLANKEAMETLVYEFNRNDTLKITREFPGGLSCKKGGTYKVRQVMVLAFGDSLNEFKVSRSMIANLDRAGVAAPTEVTRRLLEDANRTRTSVPMGYATYMTLAHTLSSSSSSKPICL